MSWATNIEIQALIDKKDFEHETYTEEEKEFLRKYDGAGGQAKQGATGRGVLDEFYTPDYICEYMYKLAVKYGYRSGHILEPSIAIGNVIKPFIDNTNYKTITGFEINPYTKRICEILYPDVEVIPNYFETAFLLPERFVTKMPKSKITWLKHYPFDLVIGNPPYGVHKNKYSMFFRGPDKFRQVETFFMYKGMQLLKKGGLLIYLTSSNFMRTGLTNWQEKERIGKYADFVDAYRLPRVFAHSDVPTDILIFKRK